MSPGAQDTDEPMFTIEIGMGYSTSQTKPCPELWRTMSATFGFASMQSISVNGHTTPRPSVHLHYSNQH
jgi:hypothetical protein